MTTPETHRNPEAREPSYPADPECPHCGGVGERFWHTDNCRNDDCALAGGLYDCDGQVEECPCRWTKRAEPTP
jgi:hypothetical protein